MVEVAGETKIPLPNIDALLGAHVRQGVGAALADTRASVVFEVAPAGIWTVALHEGRVRLRRGAARRPQTIVRVDPRTLAAILEGKRSGVEAFLDGTLTVRGNLALALAIDGAFDVGHRPPEHPRARYTDVLGARTFYLAAGPPEAPPVLLLHGLGATNASMLPLLPALAHDHRVIAPDTAGFGASGAPRWRYSIEELAAWLREFQRQVGADPAAMVGNSLGGRLAIEAGLSAPASVTRMVLLCPSPAFRRMRQLAPAVRLLSPDLGRVPMRFSNAVVMRAVRLMFAEPRGLPHDWYAAAGDEFRRVMRDPAHRRAFFATARHIYLEEAYGERGFWDRLPQLTTPTLFVWGRRDRLVPIGFERHVVAALPQADSVVLDDCGHVPQYELPRRTAALTRDFLAGQRPTGGAGQRPARRRDAASRGG